MRYTAGDVLRRPSRIAWWWIELHFRRNARNLKWWSWLLFEDGQGWLRWKASDRVHYGDGMYSPPEVYWVFPPAKRLCLAIRYRAKWPLDFRDEDRRKHRAW